MKYSEAKLRDFDRALAAYHEAGHIIMCFIGGLPVYRANVKNCNQQYGVTVIKHTYKGIKNLADLSRYDHCYTEMLFGGKVAEKIYFDAVYGKESPKYTHYGYTADMSMVQDLIKAKRIGNLKFEEKVTKLLKRYWNELTVVAKLLINKIYINYDDIKLILLNSDNKKYWNKKINKLEKIR